MHHFPLHTLLTGFVLASLAGCGMTAPSMPHITAVSAVNDLMDGQLFCQLRDAMEARKLAMQTASGQPILAKGADAGMVTSVCAIAGAVAVVPPAPGETAARMTVTLPPSIVVPLG